MNIASFATKDKEEEFVILSPIDVAVEFSGKLIYNEGAQAWNTLRLKKELMQKFPYLKEKQGNFSYKMLFANSFEELQDKIEELKKKGQTIPILFFLMKKRK